MIAAVMPFLGPQRRHEDHAGQGRAEVRDHVEQPRDHSQREGVARPEQPGREPLRGSGDRGDDDDADRPARDRGRHALPDVQPAHVLARHQHAPQRRLQLHDVGEQEHADEDDREGDEEGGDEVARDAEHGRDRVRHRRRDLVGAGSARSRRRRCRRASQRARPTRGAARSSAGRSWRKSRTAPTSGTRNSSPTTSTREGVPSTVTAEASPRDMFVFAITYRSGASNTSARKIPTKTTRNVSPIAQNAPEHADGRRNQQHRPHRQEQCPRGCVTYLRVI